MRRTASLWRVPQDSCENRSKHAADRKASRHFDAATTPYPRASEVIMVATTSTTRQILYAKRVESNRGSTGVWRRLVREFRRCRFRNFASGNRVVDKRETCRSARDVHAMAEETTPAEGHSDVSQVLESILEAG